MKKFTCIVCPNGCELTVSDDLKVSGNTCKRGEEFAIEEITCPKRVITTTIKTIFNDSPVVSVKTDGGVKKELMFDCMNEINKTIIKERVKAGTIVIKNVLNSGVNVITTKDL